MPPDLRDWIGKDHMVHFNMDAVDALDLTSANPSKHSGPRPRGKKIKLAQDQIAELLEKAEDADSTPVARQPHHPGATVAETMAHRLRTKIGRALYKLRKETVEPVCGIIKEVLGFRRFMLRGMEKMGLESDLVKSSYHLEKMYHRRMRFSAS